VLFVEPQHFKQAIKVVLDSLFQSLYRVGLQSEGSVAFASDSHVNAWITDSHFLGTSFGIFASIYSVLWGIKTYEMPNITFERNIEALTSVYRCPN
jgi:hypothetical protein